MCVLLPVTAVRLVAFSSSNNCLLRLHYYLLFFSFFFCSSFNLLIYVSGSGRRVILAERFLNREKIMQLRRDSVTADDR